MNRQYQCPHCKAFNALPDGEDFDGLCGSCDADYYRVPEIGDQLLKHLHVNVTEYSDQYGFLTTELTQVGYETAELIMHLCMKRMTELDQRAEDLEPQNTEADKKRVLTRGKDVNDFFAAQADL